MFGDLAKQLQSSVRKASKGAGREGAGSLRHRGHGGAQETLEEREEEYEDASGRGGGEGALFPLLCEETMC